MRATVDFPTPISHLMRLRPDEAVMYMAPDVVAAQARRFIDGFDGLVTFAVKANPRPEVLEALVRAGVRAFDVASVAEMHMVRAACPAAVLHYNNPVRSLEEVALAAQMGVVSASVDDAHELEKLRPLLAARGGLTEVSVRLKLPVKGAVYDFGSKFGVGPDDAVALLRRVADMGFTPAMTFHPGTQCEKGAAWGAYIRACADVARRAGVTLARLNVGGGFPAQRVGDAPDLGALFALIRAEVDGAFGANPPALVCEPGRALVAEAFSLAARIKAFRADGSVFLNDGIYGGLAEWRDMPGMDRVQVIGPDGALRGGAMQGRVAYGPTCDSLDRLPDPLPLPRDAAEGDWVLFHGMGAYSLALATRFNGYGPEVPVVVAGLAT